MGWKIEEKSLIKEFKFKNFVDAVEFVNKIMQVAESENHHPDILIYSYNKVRIMISTHSENKITEKDYALAKSIDEIFQKDI